VSSAGAVTGGTGSEGAGLLRRSREISDLKEEVAELGEQLAVLNKDRDDVTSRISSLQREKDEIAKELQSKQINHTSLQKDLSQCQQRLARLEKELSVVESECKALEKEIATLEEGKEQLAADTAALEKQSAEINRKIAALQAEARSKVQQRDAVVQQCTNMRVQLASKKQQEKGLAEKLSSLERGRAGLLQTLSSHQTSASSDGETEKGIAGKISVQGKLLEELFRERSRVEGEISKLEAQRQKAQGELQAADQQIKERRQSLDQLNQEKYQLEVKKTQLQMNLDSLASKMRERYGVSLDDLQRQSADDTDKTAQASENADETTALSEDELAGRMDELRTRMEKMGSVNLTAIEEYNRQKERYDLQVAQKEDLSKAKDKLYSIIQRINRESRERLKETFESVNASFQELFKRLFGGGHAELVMVGDGDVLESGLEIIARPRGKKLQAISMLSSGERSLTAIAILFALFEIKPSPFCVLDEVDAALDDANVGRFTDMVKEFSKNTQFIIITHNKRTMEMADVLYGVTMEESGVSKLVSLRMSDGGKVSQLAS
jgi:chromosome segregation protein